MEGGKRDGEMKFYCGELGRQSKVPFYIQHKVQYLSNLDTSRIGLIKWILHVKMSVSPTAP